jgi:hypothetical protein
MGAMEFANTVSAETARDAFLQARDGALYDHGHSGYTGTIAEKDEFIMIDMPADFTKADLHAKMQEVIEDDDKWGPAHCINVSKFYPNETMPCFVFFGLASS